MTAELEGSRRSLHFVDLDFLIAVSHWWAQRIVLVEKIFMLKVALGLPIYCPKVEKEKMRQFRLAAKNLNVPIVLPLMRVAIRKSKKQQEKIRRVLKIPKKLLKKRRRK
jgi:hypothetical protein